MNNYLCLTLLALFVLVTSCGKKGDPTLIAYAKPQAVTCSPIEVLANTATVKWDYVGKDLTRLKGFIIEISNTADFQALKVSQVPAETKSLQDNITGARYYRIKAVNKKGISSDYCYVGFDSIPALASVQKLTATNTGSFNTISWQAVADASSYRVYKTKRQGEILKVFETTQNQLLDDTLPLNDVYYSVQAVKTHGQAVFHSEASPAQAVSIPLQTVKGLKATSDTSHVYLSWDEVEHAEGYKIYRKLSTEADFIAIAVSTVPTFIDTPQAEGLIMYQVRAFRLNVLGKPSEAVSITKQSNR